MANSKLLTGEKVLMSSDKDMLILTNYRVRLNQAGSWASNYISIALDCIASCGLVTKSKPLLLVIAAICGVIGLTQDRAGGLLVIAAVLVVIYFVTRASVIAISSNGGDKIIAPVKGMGRENILDFLEAIEEARFKFLGR